MRSIILFFVLLAVSVAWADHEELKKVAQGCVKELGIKMDDNGYPNREDAEKKCFSKCVGLKMGTLDAKGTIIESKLPEHMRANAKKCADTIKETDLCKKANAFSKCMFSKNHKKE